jgi:hypothetical protein
MRSSAMRIGAAMPMARYDGMQPTCRAAGRREAAAGGPHARDPRERAGRRRPVEGRQARGRTGGLQRGARTQGAAGRARRAASAQLPAAGWGCAGRAAARAHQDRGHSHEQDAQQQADFPADMIPDVAWARDKGGGRFGGGGGLVVRGIADDLSVVRLRHGRAGAQRGLGRTSWGPLRLAPCTPPSFTLWAQPPFSAKPPLPACLPPAH